MFGGIPFGFEQFGGMGGMGGMESRQPVDNTELYETLGVSKDSSQQQIKKAFRKLAAQHHPDKGGDPEMFKKINAAHEILSDADKRDAYNKYGMEGVKDGGAGGGGADIFDLFGMGGGMRSRRGPAKAQRGEDVTHSIKVSLDEFYKGNTRKMQLQRNIECPKCHFKGSLSGDNYTCTVCKGSGTQVRIQQIGPGMIQQTQSKCRECKGTGQMEPPPSDRCDACNGKGLVQEKKQFEVHIEQGMKSNQRIVLRGEAGCSEKNVQPGDVVFILEQKKHPIFERATAFDLVMEKDIALVDALCGLDFKIRHLDGRLLDIKTAPGQVIKPRQWVKVEEEGMPMHGRPYQKGNLYIQFNVVFPDNISAREAEQIRKVLPPSTVATEPMVDDADIEEVSFQPVEDIKTELRSRQDFAKAARMEAYDSDDSDAGHRRGGGVQCAAQ